MRHGRSRFEWNGPHVIILVAVPLIACSTTVQKLFLPNVPLEKRLGELYVHWPRGAIAAARAVTRVGMLGVNCYNSTRKILDEMWFGPK